MEKREENMGAVVWERKRVVVFVGVLSMLGKAGRRVSPSSSGRKIERNPSPLSPSTPNQTISQWVLSLTHQAAAPARRC